MAAVTSCENASFAIRTSPMICLVYPQNFVYALFSVTLGTTVKLRANGRHNIPTLAKQCCVCLHRAKSLTGFN